MHCYSFRSRRSIAGFWSHLLKRSLLSIVFLVLFLFQYQAKTKKYVNSVYKTITSSKGEMCIFKDIFKVYIAGLPIVTNKKSCRTKKVKYFWKIKFVTFSLQNILMLSLHIILNCFRNQVQFLRTLLKQIIFSIMEMHFLENIN